MQGQTTVHAFSTIGLSDGARRFPGFKSTSAPAPRSLPPRGALHFWMAAGDLLALETDVATDVYIIVHSSEGRVQPQQLGLAEAGDIQPELFDAAPYQGWRAARGIDPATAICATRVSLSEDIAPLKAQTACDLWVLRLLGSEELVSNAAAAPVRVTQQKGDLNAPVLPAPLGEIREEFTVPRGSALAYRVAKGELLQVIDVQGQQCSDFVAFRQDALDQGREVMIDSTATRSMVRRAYPGPGLFDKFFDPDMRPLLRVEQDTCGHHDTFGLACTARGYEERGFPGHLNCSDNISHAGAPFGVEKRGAWPAINFFWNTWMDPHVRNLMSAESRSRPGDYVAMRALDDLLCISTACPDDIDPINGWNPTDVHVRIYHEHTPVRRAIAYRQKEDAAMQISEESAFHARTSELTEHFAPARDVWAPVSYPGIGTLGEYWACRERVTLQDMSSLRKYDVIGPDAERLLSLALTRDPARLAQWRGVYAVMCDEAGEVIDDGTLFRMAPDLFRWCCGSEESARVLADLAKDHNMSARVHGLEGTLPNLALQGPRSRELLEKIVFTQPHVPSLQQMKWFGATIARLNDREGTPFMLSRTGYTGELGYELFCSASDAVQLWDAIMKAGEEFGIAPMGGAALDTIRIEAGFVAAGQEFVPGVDAYEAGLGFAIDMRKPDFVGRAALERNQAAPRRVLRGLELNCSEIPNHGDPIFVGERQVGVVTSGTFSPTLRCGIAMARLQVEHGEPGTNLEIGQLDGHMKRLHAQVCETPFVDPTRSRARS